MNKKTFLAVTIILSLTACSKEKESSFATELVPLNFSLSTLATEVMPFTRASNTSIAAYFTTLEYFGYSEDVQIFKGSQTYSELNDDFGLIKTAVPTGNYYLGFFGVGEGVGNYRMSIGNIAGDNDYIESTGREIWYKEFKNYSVTNSTSDIEVTMTRKTGCITLNITDVIPSHIGRVNIEIFYRSQYQLTDGTAKTMTSATYSTDIPTEGDKLSEFNFNCFPSSGSIVNLSIYDKNDVLLDQRHLSVEVFENRKTVITGELFNNVGSKEFRITVSDDWGEDNIVDLE